MNLKKKILFGFLGLSILAVLAYFSSTSISNRVNQKWNTAYVKIARIVRNFQLAQIKDEAPGIGPGNKQISIPDPEHFSFAIMGDTQMFNFPGNTGEFKKAVARIQKINPALVMTVGDLIQGCNTTDKCMNYKMWRNIAKPLLPITYEVVGNHDRIVGNSSAHKISADKAWQNFFNLPTNGPTDFEEFVYSFNVGNSHFVVLDSEKPKEHEISDEQLAWLDKDLSENKQANTFVFYHEPAFPMSYKIDQSLDTSVAQRDALWTILDKHNVTAVFNGHEHIFSRQQIGAEKFPKATHEIFQFIIGNTDAMEKQNVKLENKQDFFHQGHDFVLVEVAGREITVKVFDIDDGSLIDSFSFAK